MIFHCLFCNQLHKMLYDALDTLQGVFYMDTNSVSFTHKSSGTILPTANYLGNFTSELENVDYLTEFVAAVPKNYAYLTQCGNKCCKVRGFTLNECGQQVLHFRSMKNLVLNEIIELEDQPWILTLKNPHRIVRHPPTKTIKTVQQNKQYKLVFHKLVIYLDTFQ